jgi:hypothetical protein
MRRFRITAVASALALASMTLLLPGHASGQDVVVRWNTFTIDAVKVDGHSPAPLQAGGPTTVSRAFAIVHAGIYDAVNSFQRLYTPYIAYVPVPPGAQDAAVVAAASFAGHDTLAYLLPNQTDIFDAELALSLLLLPPDQVEIGRVVGTAAAQQIIQARQNDGSGPEPLSPGSTAPGQWRPTPQDYRGGLDPYWGQVTPFTLKTGSQFRPAPPPALNSPEYAMAYYEVKMLGGDGFYTPTQRTPDQTNIAEFWSYDDAAYGTPPLHNNQVLQRVAEEFPPVAAAPHVGYARLFALVNLAQGDCGISAWDSKWYYKLWRPISGIRLGFNTPATPQDPTWTPLGYTLTSPGTPPFFYTTPDFPAYTSGHATFGGGMFSVLKYFYGFDNLPHPVWFFSDQSLNFRPYTSFSQPELENTLSRIYLGVHWRYDGINGQAAGEQIGAWVFNNFLKPL